jgi:hypothetical protein
VGDTFTTGQVLEKSVGIRKTLLAVKPLLRGVAAGRAVGIACGVKNSGIGNGVVEYGKARLVPDADGHGVAVQRLHRDGPGPADGAGAVRGGGHRPAALDLRPKVDSTFASAAARPRLARHAAGRRAVVCRAAPSCKADLDAGHTLARAGGPRSSKAT